MGEIANYFKFVGKGMYEGFLGIVDGESDDKARDLFRQGLKKVAVSSQKLSKARMRRLALLLAEAASSVAEELK